jgi:hypothetical protein
MNDFARRPDQWSMSRSSAVRLQANRRMKRYHGEEERGPEEGKAASHGA